MLCGLGLFELMRADVDLCSRSLVDLTGDFLFGEGWREVLDSRVLLLSDFLLVEKKFGRTIETMGDTNDGIVCLGDGNVAEAHRRIDSGGKSISAWMRSHCFSLLLVGGGLVQLCNSTILEPSRLQPGVNQTATNGACT